MPPTSNMVLETYCYGVEKTDEGKREFMYSGKIISTLKKLVNLISEYLIDMNKISIDPI
jgi:hypothetical protein